MLLFVIGFVVIGVISHVSEVDRLSDALFGQVPHDDFAVFTPANLAKYDVILFNNSTRLNMPPTARSAVLGHLAKGKGVSGLHAGADNFGNWPEGVAMMEILHDIAPGAKLIFYGVSEDPNDDLNGVDAFLEALG